MENVSTRDENTPISFALWVALVREAIANAPTTVGTIISLVLQRVRVESEEEWRKVLEIKVGLLTDVERIKKDAEPDIYSKLSDLKKETVGWRNDYDSPLMQDFVEDDGSLSKFCEKYIFTVNPPSNDAIQALMNGIMHTLGSEAEGCIKNLSSTVTDKIVKRAGDVMEGIGKTDDLFEKYVLSKELDFLRDFVRVWDGKVKTTFFSKEDIAKIGLLVASLQPTFEASDKTGNIKLDK